MSHHIMHEPLDTLLGSTVSLGLIDVSMIYLCVVDASMLICKRLTIGFEININMIANDFSWPSIGQQLK